MADPTFSEFLSTYSPEVQALAHRARGIVLAVAPQATEKVWPGWKLVGYGTGPTMGDVVCGIMPFKSRMNFMFGRGVELPDPEGLLEGVGKGGRHLKIETAEALGSPAVHALLRAAFDLHRAGPATAPRPAKEPSPSAPEAYQVGGSKTVNVPVEALYAAWIDEPLRERWLPGSTFTIRKANAAKSLRITWEDGSNLEILFYPKGDTKSQVTLDQRKLPDNAAIERMKTFWKERLAKLKEVLEE
jgi:hypothetical protein